MKALSKNQSVLLTKEPWNEYDEFAVSVNTLSGQNLGWVPRTHNQLFKQQQVMGRVLSIGVTKNKTYGARVAATPALPALSVDPLPAALAAAYNELPKSLPSGKWEALRQQALEQARGACEVTGMPGTAQPIGVGPIWRCVGFRVLGVDLKLKVRVFTVSGWIWRFRALGWRSVIWRYIGMLWPG